MPHRSWCSFAATRPSRWYVTPTFTTFIAISLLLYANPADAQSRFNERVGETLLGVALAYVFGLLVPWLATRLRPEATSYPVGFLAEPKKSGYRCRHRRNPAC